MLLHVVHETAYAYTPRVKTAQHMAHLTPADDGAQRLMHHRLRITPEPALLTGSVDVYGNRRSFFSLQAAHDSLSVVAESVVATAGTPPRPQELAWEDARERMRYHRAAHYDPATEFVFASPYVPRHEDLAAYARPSFPPGRALMQACEELMQRIHTDFAYATSVTDVGTPALQALALRKGVCQDFAHVMLGCLRSLGLPARYVSGYLLTEAAPGHDRLVGSDASHAWVAVYQPAAEGPGAWAEFDPTNNRAPGEDYVRLAVGRDYSDVSPMRGVIHGGGKHTLKVAVTVTPVDAARAAQLAETTIA
jgi:transglutaminase-like putative cysteine protease